MQVIKRDGRTTLYDRNKIKEAIAKAFKAVKPDVDNNLYIIDVTDQVNMKLMYNQKVTIEEIQDLVEKALMEKHHYEVAKAYILYRDKRAQERIRLAAKHTVPDEKEEAEFRELCEKNSVVFGHSPMREFVYMRTYSRWIEDKGRREIWSETVDRYLQFLRANIGSKLTEKDYEDIYQYVFQQKVMPSMRLLQTAGSPASRCNVCIYNCAFTAPTNFKDLADIMYLSMSGTGVGFSVEAKNAAKFPSIKPVNGETIHMIIDDSKEGWCDAFQFELHHCFEGTKVVFDYSKLRPAGARLKTMGGRSSGPGPLMDLMKFTEEIIEKRRNTTHRLSTLDVHDIICKIGQIVVAGGVRRTALISISDFSDRDVRDCKKGNFWLSDSQRCLANNSAAYDEKPDQITFMKEWLSLAESGTGERGIFNRGSLSKVIPQRRVDLIGDKVGSFGMNPCVTSDTWIHTVEGPRQVKNLIGVKIDLIINGKPYPMESEGFFHTGKKAVFEVETKKGFKVKLTANHPMLKYTKAELIWTKLENLKIGDEVMTSNHRAVDSWKGAGGTFEEGWLIGELIGDGGIIISNNPNKQNLGYVRFWGESAKFMANIALSYVNKHCDHRSDLGVVYNEENKAYQVTCVGLYNLCVKYGITHEKETTNITEKTSSEFQRGFVRGFFDADGSVQGSAKAGFSIRLSQSNIPRLEVVHRMLSRIGVGSYIVKNRRLAHKKLMPDGKGGQKEYFCKAQHELLVSAENIKLFSLRVGFQEPAKTSRLEEIVALRYSEIDTEELNHSHYNETIQRESLIYPGKHIITKQEASQTSKTRKYINRYGWKFHDSIISITAMEPEDVYDVTVAEVHEFCANGIRVSNCGEVLLQPFQFCNLTEIILRAEDTIEQISEKTRIATLLGTCQAYFSNFKYIDPKWKENQDLERLLGVSITGIYDHNPLTGTQLDELKQLTIRWNADYARQLGINPATAITCVKPSGTVSQMVDSSSGIHPRFSEYYIRRIRISVTDPLLKLMKDQGYPCLPEVGQFEPNINTYVLEFPIQAPKGSKTVGDITALEQLDNWLLYKTRYTEHNPSVTIYVKPDEWLAVGKWIWDNWDYITGLSFLPYSDHVYELAPYEAITKEKYLLLSSNVKKVDFSKLRYYEKTDTTDTKRILACAGGMCEL
jgi:ribonucleotide reductase, class II